VHEFLLGPIPHLESALINRPRIMEKL
jgi:hypothetical protein